VHQPRGAGHPVRKLAGRMRLTGRTAAAGLLAVVAVCGIATATPALAKTTAPLAVATTYLPPGTAQTSYSAQLAATGGTKPYTWSISAGSLPAGLTLHPATGAITGKPTVTGPDSFTVEVTDSESTPASARAAESVTVTAPPLSVTTTSLPGAVAGVAYSAKLAATGGISPYTWLLSGGTLPEGLTLHTNGAISGTPKSAGSATFTVEVADSDTPAETAPGSLSITVGTAALVVTTGTDLPTAHDGTAYSVKLAADGGITPYTWSLTSGTLPAGLTLRTNGTIDGTPSADGTYGFSVQVSDAETPPATAGASFTLVVPAPLTIQGPRSLPDGYTGESYGVTLNNVTGGVPPYTWSLVSGSLPAGLTAFPNGTDTVSGTITGAPGTYTCTVQMSDSENPPATVTEILTMTVTAPPLTITTTSLPPATESGDYSATLTAANGTQPYTWSVAPNQPLPAGLTLDPGSGVISGAPAVVPGTYTFIVQVTDSANSLASANLSLVVLPPALTIVVDSKVVPTGYIDASYDLQLTAIYGTGPYTWSTISGSLPPGLGLGADKDDADSVAIQGFPTGTPASYTFTVQVADAESPPATANVTLTITVVPFPSITTTSLDPAVDGDPYSAALTVDGGVPPYTWSIANGTLPPGLAIDPSTGVISGTPTAAALGLTYSFAVGVTDSYGEPAFPVSLAIQVISPYG
jgi:Putative Ig domain